MQNSDLLLLSSVETQKLLVLADTSLIMAQRLSEWCGHAPILEQDIAISNIALDYLGQARNWYQLIAKTLNKREGTNTHTEDTLAYLRDVTDFKNLLLVELPNNNWAYTIARIFFISNYQHHFYTQLLTHTDSNIAAIAEKSIKELNYHVQWSGDWMIRLGDGTDESKQKMVEAVNNWWSYTGEFFEEKLHAMFGTNATILEQQWMAKTKAIFEEATLHIPENKWMQTGGIEGKHTEHLGFILAEMQFLQKTYPNATW